MSTEPPPRVVLDARVDRGGAGRYASDLLASLPAVASADLHPVTRGRNPMRAPFTPWGRRAVAREVRRAAADLLHGLHLELAPVDVPAVVTIHDLIPLEHPASMPSPARRYVYDRLLHASVAGARLIIVPSVATARALERFGADPARVRIVGLGVGPQFHPLTAEQRQESRRRFASGRRYVVAMTGRSPHKNAGAVVSASGCLPAALNLDIVAPGRPPPSGAGAVRFIGRLGDHELCRLYGGAEATLVASHLEGFGLPLLESMACRTPVVCGPRVGALSRLGPGALVVDVTSPMAMAAALTQVAEEAEVRERLAERGRAAAAPLTRDAMARSTCAVYCEVLAGRAAYEVRGKGGR